MIQELPQTLGEQDTAITSNFTITLADCVESVGVGLVSTERALALVPSEFRLAGDGQPVTPLVVLAIKGNGIAVAGYKPQAGKLVQVGLVIAPPDGTGDVNTFLLWHYTSDARLARSLKRLGLDTQYIPSIGYDVSRDGNGGSTSISVPHPARPTLSLSGMVAAPGMPGAFVANWWARVERGLMKMQTSVPDGLIGEAQLTLTTGADTPLGRLIGGDSMTFAVLQRFNMFPHARTEVSIIFGDEETAQS